MAARFTVLGSGSLGNASLLETPDGSILIDCGLPPADLGARLLEVGSHWDRIVAVVLTHTHGDHWNRYTFQQLHRLGIRFYAHPLHLNALDAEASFEPLRQANLAVAYPETSRFQPVHGLVCQAVRVSHDSDPTFAFRFDAQAGKQGQTWSLGHATDLGFVSDELMTALAGVDVLAIEFNHDVQMERRSRRPRFLVERVLGDQGHLSNRQAAEAVHALATVSEGQLQAVLQVHLSRECNTPELAAEAGRNCLEGTGCRPRVITSLQHRVTEPITIAERPTRSVRVPKLPVASRRHVQPPLPDFD